MSKFTVVLVLLVLATIAWARPSGVESSQIDRVAYERCLDQFFSAANNALRGYSRSFNVNEHFLCFSKALGWQNSDGSLNRKNIEGNVDKELGYAKAQQFKDECIIEYSTPELTAGHLFNCAKNYADQNAWLKN
ncbi:uncharacterized protein LOC126740020 [Anthonomus grandis grandis]|uniref:Putative odorant-binding protein 18 n=1 Tax=Anthonomus grandis TaxID=7044 RepID=A0A2P9JZF5_ANTGR|nr:uncharacterized protein LOC126740020 [Anthonomus grandis grandis]AVI04897.1 putative odorant-binding protein 18 [Anthonomus grandis]